MKRLDVYEAIKQVKANYDAMVAAADAVERLRHRHPRLLAGHFEVLESLQMLVGGCADLYLVWMFARFENALRHYWRAAGRRSRPATETLLDRIAARHGIPQDVVDRVHEIRAYRNAFLHEDVKGQRRLHLDEASRDVNTFVSRLPREW